MDPTSQSPLLGSSPFPIGPTRASDSAESYLRWLILSGQLAPGQKLPPERELSKQLGVAPVTLRAALRSLETVGLIVIKRGPMGGSSVVDAETLHQRWKEQTRIRKPQLRQLLEFSALMEEDIACLAAKRRTKADMKALETVAQALLDDTVTETRWHYHLHQTLARAAHNEYLEQASVTIQGEIFIPIPVGVLLRDIAEFKAIHVPIVDAVRMQDPERAVEAARMHAALRESKFGVGRNS
jgi:GntR family transcriptional regulator, transcriptional repressor for pyruvate dehydrogenase complex